MLGDKDVRVRMSAAVAVCQYIKATASRESIKTETTKNSFQSSSGTLLNNFIGERIYSELPKPLCDLRVHINNSLKLEKVLGKVLYTLANMLLELNDKNQQVCTHQVYFSCICITLY